MAYSICRIVKLKSGGAIAASEAHTRRQRDTPNADLNKDNERFIGNLPGSFTLEQEVFERIGNQKIRKDAVLCVEILLSASPEFFRPDNLGEAGYWDRQQLEDWKQANHRWLEQQFGDRIVRAELHLDESTPHIHAYLVPLDKQGKLNCKSIFGDRVKLSQFQDSYGIAMAPLGLERGIKGSRATHTQVKEYYAAVVKEPDLGLTLEEMQHQLADRQRVLKENEALEQTAKALAQDKEALEEQLQNLQAVMKRQAQEVQRWQEYYQAVTVQMRSLPLPQIAFELGLDLDPNSKHKWRNEEHIVKITGSKFYDWKELKGGGGAIGLVMHLQRCSFTDAVSWLRDHFGESTALQTVTEQITGIVTEKPQQLFIAPAPNEENWQRVREYLTRSRKLPAALVDKLHQEELVYAGEQQNVVFVRRTLDGEVVGASLQNPVDEKDCFEKLAYGSRRSQGWFYSVAGGKEEDPIQKAVLVESAIEALSYQTLHPPQAKTLILSTDGVGYVPVEWLKQVGEVAIAFNHDQTGLNLAEQLKQELSQIHTQSPTYKDWNEDLHHHLNRLLQHQFGGREISRESARKQGLEL